MANLYLDKAGLQILLTKLNAKYEGMFLGLHAEADVAKKVANKLTLNIDGVANEFDGSGAKSLDVAAAVHTHKAADISDFKTEVRKEIFGATAGDGTVDIHKHTNLSELELIAAGDVAKWNAKIGSADVARLAYSNAGMSGVIDVKGALDTLVKNMQMVVNEDIANKTNMISIKGAIDTEVQARKDADDALQEAIDALEAANAEGGAVANAIKAVADDLAEFEEAQAEKEAAQDKAIADEASRADAEEKRIVGLVEAEAQTARAAEQAALKAGQDAQVDVDALEKYVKGDSLDGKGGLEARVATNEAFVAAQPAIDQAQDGRLDALEALFKGDNSVDAKIEKVAQDLADFEGEQATKEAAQDQAIAAKVAQADYNEKVEEFEGRIAANEAFVAAHDDTARDARIKALEDDAPVKQAAIEKAQSDANSANEKIDAFLDASAVKDDTINTLKEIQLYIEEHGTEAAGMVADIAKAQKAADDEAARAKAEEADIRADFAAADEAVAAAAAQDAADKVKVVADALADEKDVNKDGSLAKKIADEIARADAEEKDIRADFAAADAQVLADAKQDAADKVAAEKELREAAEKDLSDRIAAFEGEGEGSVKAQVEAVQGALDAFEEAQATKDQGQDERIKALEDANKDGGAVKEAIDAVQAEVDAEEQARAAADDALAAKIGTVAADTNLAAMIAAVQADVDQNEADCDAAIKAEQERAEKAEADNEGRIVVLEGDMTQAKADIAANTQALANIGAPMKEEDIQGVIDLVFQ